MQRRIIPVLLLTLMMLLSLTACGSAGRAGTEPQTPAATEPGSGVPSEREDLPAEKTGDIVILFTSDVHCGVDQGDDHRTTCGTSNGRRGRLNT